MHSFTLIRQLKSADFAPICEHNGFPPYLHNITDHHCRVGDTVPILIAVLWGMLCTVLSRAALKRGNHLSHCKALCCYKIYFSALIIYPLHWWLHLKTCCLLFFLSKKNTASQENNNSEKDCTAFADAKPAQIKQNRGSVILKAPTKGVMHLYLHCQQIVPFAPV